MNTRTVLISLCLVGLSGCQFTEDFFDWLSSVRLECNDIQSAADDCWAGADDEEAESECESLDFEAASCTWVANGESTAESDDEDDDDAEAEAEEDDEECESLEDYADACWDWAETEEERAECEEIELELEACLEAGSADPSDEDES